MSSPFKGRISITTDINGKKSTIDKEFNSKTEFDNFSKNQGLSSESFSIFSDIEQAFFDSLLFPKRFGISFGLPRFLTSVGNSGEIGHEVSSDELRNKYGLGKYEDALEESLKKKQEIERKKVTVDELNEVIETLRGYEEKFKSEKNEAMLKSLEDDIRKYENQKKVIEEEIKGA